MRWIAIGLCLFLCGCLGSISFWVPFSGPPPTTARTVEEGTGIIVGDGLILTAGHLADECQVIRIAAASDRFRAVPVTVKAVEPTHDGIKLDVVLLAATPSSAPSWPAARFSDLWPDDAELNELPVHAAGEVHFPDGTRLIGYPHKAVAPHPVSISVSHLAAARPDDAKQFHLWTFAADVMPGFSGGPIVDPDGAVLGLEFRGSDAGTPDYNGIPIANAIGLAAATHDLLPFLAENGVSIPFSTPPQPIEDSLVQVFCFR